MQAIGLDLLGHGRSDKSYQSSDYAVSKLADDVVLLMDTLGLARASLLGFSLGSVIALDLLHRYPERCNRSVLIATGDGLIGKAPYTMAAMAPKWAEALDFPEFPKHLPKQVSTYWNLASKIGGDRAASAAAARTQYLPFTPEQLVKVVTPVLVVSGERDLVLGQGPLLAKSLPSGRYLEIPEADHFMLAISALAQVEVANFLSSPPIS